MRVVYKFDVGTLFVLLVRYNYEKTRILDMCTHAYSQKTNALKKKKKLRNIYLN